MQSICVFVKQMGGLSRIEAKLPPDWQESFITDAGATGEVG